MVQEWWVIQLGLAMCGKTICAWWLWCPTFNISLHEFVAFLSLHIFVLNTYRYLILDQCTNSTKLTAGCLLGRLIFTSALILAFIYTWAQDNRGRKVMFFVIQIPAEWLPFAMLAVTLVMHGWGSVMSQGTGILAAHLYDFLTRIYPTFGGGRNYITTPAFIQRIFDGHRATSRTYGTAYRPGQQSTQGSSSGWSSSFGSSWSSRGPGRRLGGD